MIEDSLGLKIGIFDSGIGGLTVAKAIKNKLPQAELVYFGDTAHLPYGDKSPASIRHYSAKIAQFLLSENCTALVIACNTASAHAFIPPVESLVPIRISIVTDAFPDPSADVGSPKLRPAKTSGYPVLAPMTVLLAWNILRVVSPAGAILSIVGGS